MNSIQNAKLNLRFLDELAAKNTGIHRLHPLIKLLTTLAFIITVVSFPKYEMAALIPLIFYPLAVITLADLPGGYLMRQIIPALPLVFFIGIFNPWFDTAPWLIAGGCSISWGWVSFISILIKFSLTVLVSFLLVATSGMNEIGAALEQCKIPRIFVTQLLLIFRYLSVLMEEAGNIIQAYSLRSGSGRGVAVSAWGSMVGQLLLRTMERAGRIYHAMLCRGFTGQLKYLRTYRMGLKDLSYLGGWVAFFSAVRLVNIPEWLGSLIMGVMG